MVILLSIVAPSLWAARQQQIVRRVHADLRALVLAADRFFSEYRSWPSEYMGTFGDIRYGAKISNREVVNTLRAEAGSGNPGHRLNPHQIDFFEVAGYGEALDRINATGDFVDPWGQPYQIVVDTDLDNYCHAADSIYIRVPDEGLIAWSCGPDRRSDTPDDILSWKR